jgi:hypothetical protein
MKIIFYWFVYWAIWWMLHAIVIVLNFLFDWTLGLLWIVLSNDVFVEFFPKFFFEKFWIIIINMFINCKTNIDYKIIFLIFKLFKMSFNL